MEKQLKNKVPYPVIFCDLGYIDYDECSLLQEAARENIIAARNHPGFLFFVEHPHVYTHGRLASRRNLLLDEPTLTRRGITVRRIDRGGDYTYHGPGQLVAYPVFDLKRTGMNLRQFLHSLEETIIKVLGRVGIDAARNPRNMGVWVGDNKICAVGVGVRKWVSKHGLAFNINTDMSYFDGIVPCGVKNGGVVSMKELNGGSEQDWRKITAMTRQAFVDVFELDLRRVERDELEDELFAGQREKTALA